MYLWIKALHVVAIISWMAGLLYLPRLFVYHAETAPGPQSETFKIMERRLYRYIMTPAMTVAWLTGLYLAVEGGALSSGWFHVKATLVVLMTAAHVHDGVLQRRFAADANRHSSRYYRVLNEIPTLLMIGIVVLVIVKPF
ncbi:protoporphyrinogen oxidase HemJ [Methylocystis sp. WRRC1]|uniref:protoporphyrinogen oxidase HemJ n=1 Tax=Methylocystis sp. WRRC1 TaxID=1732014 RepID=UPI001D13608F|nr:protoporphyrinogen oxidase HemJ [Methylocystis sp. WRRC1]MCC3245732.1 protoporphyrinogen oxidase HemJ [Methylocystis sp. WRRC1]